MKSTSPHSIFHFTRTMEGSSLTADVKTLAALFPPEEGHLLIRGVLDIGVVKKIMRRTWTIVMLVLVIWSAYKLIWGGLGLTNMACLTSFRGGWEKNGVNHMYSSPSKSANVLASKEHAVKVQALHHR
ncbi:hypothetical protein P691DRAFT_836487 [Macrolepiota fuliginosa MF-IS2]|uniref:Uncharacterized protein n=1 Tax=Macrolepiota fuliginosa MF-IS2 TaxID=1400762 RepID=A0A9P6C0G4_9AGAR|nr:hypothetical protein P691DRAFT_836487 [Macrolepiota fuliginosa MF-IS2]